MDRFFIIYSVDVSKDAQKTIRKWKKSNSVAVKKLKEPLPELSLHPGTGKGHPEPMKGRNDIFYSRQITAHDRIIYNIYDDEVLVSVVEVEGHYKDK